jgi:hypothetical protein
MSDMPGARMLRIVTVKFTAEAIEAMPMICTDSSQKSIPIPGLNCLEVRFA